MEHIIIDRDTIEEDERASMRRSVAQATYDDLEWQDDGLCMQTDPEIFFPEKGGSTRDAKKVCGACAVRSTCLEYALGNGVQFGIWGGLSERERRKLRRSPAKK